MKDINLVINNLVNKIRNEFDEDTVHKLYSKFRNFHKILFKKL